MSLSWIGQAALLADIFEAALRRFTPASVAVLGCAGGNGFERIQIGVTTRVVGVDINPDYIRQARERFAGRLPGLELFVGDVQTDALAFAPVKLVFAGLLFEYVDPRVTLRRVAAMLRPHGVLVAVVQLASPDLSEVTPSPFPSLRALEPVMRLVPPETLRGLAEASGLAELDLSRVVTPGRKELCVQTLIRLDPAGR